MSLPDSSSSLAASTRTPTMQVAMCSTRSCQVTELISKKIVNILIMHSQLNETMSNIRFSSMNNNQVMNSKKSVPVKDCNLGNACAIAMQALSSFCNDTGIEDGLDDGDALGNGTGAAGGLDDGDALSTGIVGEVVGSAIGETAAYRSKVAIP
jgi:hypothetical protein